MSDWNKQSGGPSPDPVEAALEQLADVLDRQAYPGRPWVAPPPRPVRLWPVLAAAAATAAAVVLAWLIWQGRGTSSPRPPAPAVAAQPAPDSRPATAGLPYPQVLLLDIPWCMMDATPEEMMMLLNPPGLNAPFPPLAAPATGKAPS